MKTFEVWIQPVDGNGYWITVRAEDGAKARRKALRAARRDKKIEFVEVDFKINKLSGLDLFSGDAVEDRISEVEGEMIEGAGK